MRFLLKKTNRTTSLRGMTSPRNKVGGHLVFLVKFLNDIAEIRDTHNTRDNVFSIKFVTKGFN